MTEFCFIRFNESLHKKQAGENDSSWKKILKTLLYTSSQSRGSIVSEKREKQKLHSLLKVLEQEYENNQSQYFETIRDSLMRSIMTILARNLFIQTASSPVQKNSVEAILLYVQQHIYNPSELNIEHLADVFHYAPEYISIFFKKHTGESLKLYIIKHKIKLIEARCYTASYPWLTLHLSLAILTKVTFVSSLRNIRVTHLLLSAKALRPCRSHRLIVIYYIHSEDIYDQCS